MGQSQSTDNATGQVEKDYEIDELDSKQREDWIRWKGNEHAIIPHTDAAGDQYCIGDAYEGIKTKDQWEILNPGPYLQYIKHLSKTWPHLEYLGHWMEVSAAPPKWRYLQHFPVERANRAKRVNVSVIDYTNNEAKLRDFDDAAQLKEGLDAAPQSTEHAQVRLIVAEDLSRDLVDTLGSYYDIDPLFFLSHIGDYLFHNTRDPWAELPSLDLEARQRPHFCLQSLRGRYFGNETDFEKAEFESGTFNVLRRLDSDRSRKRLQDGLLDRKNASVVLTRSKTSLWVKPRKQGEPVTAILLVDPTVSTGNALWGGYRPFDPTPSMAQWKQDPEKEFEAPKRVKFFDDIKYWCGRLSPQDLDLVNHDPRCIALPVYKMILADWLTTLKYMIAQLGKIEWEFERPHWGEKPSDIDSLLKKLSPWRRNVGYYQTMIGEAIARLYPPEVRAPLHALGATSVPNGTDPAAAHFYIPDNHDNGVSALWVDFRNVKRQIDEIQVRLKSIETMATNGINIEESRRAVKQNKNLARLTFLATIFIPLNFTSSFLSISPDFASAHQSIWLFFAIGIPVTLLSLAVYRKQKKRFGPKKESERAIDERRREQRPPLKKMLTTVPWLNNTERQDTRLD
ncbi:hypothetical protein M409DRAFT_65858 [Zasmidium cellare ATCC 36951]|uniref:Uncharacterized protein n=1 Tax=Zasmidium cellare ATCC 36951 TaxID=1080233 RepID=A0A6A6CNN6_ZASCE|nr:uncharacterized protein M409DRAFT_65858 [Zasmidium cellare ATCC 36951]KAF2167750.1 hypothetical protein M409DRAFT_65858 [Zasmidium cellare ATCC 36951]